MTPDPVNTHMNEAIRAAVARRRQPRDKRGRFAAEEHENPDVPKLLKLRALSAEAGDHQGVVEMDRKLRSIDPTAVPRGEGIDAGAGRGQSPHLHRNPTDAMNALLRAGARYGRERLAELVHEELRGYWH